MLSRILNHLEEWLITFLIGGATLVIFAAVLHRFLCGALFTGIVGTLGATFVWENGFHHAWLHLWGMNVGDIPEGPTSPDLEIPTWIAYSCVPLGSYLMSFRFLQVFWHFVRTGEVPHHGHGHVEGVDEDAAAAELAATDKGARA